MAENTSPNKGRLFLFKAGLILIPLVVFFIGYYVVFRIQLTKLYGYDEVHAKGYEAPEFPKLTEKQMINLGWAHHTYEGEVPPTVEYPKSSYINHNIQKPEGVTRIGVFGGSFTEGTESGYGLDFPSQLEDKLHKLGYANVEVINFGVGSYGVHQSFLLYQYLGKKYGLDIIILNPFIGHFNRDNTFIYSNNYSGVHARYVLDHDTLKLIPVKGKSRMEAIKLYHRFFQPREYLKYDIRSPNFLRPLILQFNPFYYTNSVIKNQTEKEMFETYRLIIKAFAKDAKQVIVISNNEEYYKLSANLDNDNIFFYKPSKVVYEEESHSIYTAECGHYSPFGNQFIADELVNILTARNDSVRFLKFNKPEQTVYKLPKYPLWEFDSIKLKFGPFYYRTFYNKSNMDEFEFCNEPIDLKATKTSSLLLLSNRLSDVGFLPLDYFPMDEKIRLSFKAGESVELDAGRVEAINPYIYSIEIPDTLIANSGKGWAVLLSNNSDNVFDDISIASVSDVQDVSIQIETHKLPISTEHGIAGELLDFNKFTVLEQSIFPGKENEISLKGCKTKLVVNNIAVIRTHGFECFDLADPTMQSGEVYFIVEKNGQQDQYPFLSWETDLIPFRPMLSRKLVPIIKASKDTTQPPPPPSSTQSPSTHP